MSVTDNFLALAQRFSDEMIRDNIYMVDKTVLARALKNVAPEAQNKIFRNMTDAAADEVKRVMTGMGDISISEIESAQQEIISMASQAF